MAFRTLRHAAVTAQVIDSDKASHMLVSAAWSIGYTYIHLTLELVTFLPFHLPLPLRLPLGLKSYGAFTTNQKVNTTVFRKLLVWYEPIYIQ